MRVDVGQLDILGVEKFEYFKVLYLHCLYLSIYLKKNNCTRNMQPVCAQCLVEEDVQDVQDDVS